VQWRSKGNSGTKEFFQAVQPKTSHANITELLDSTGTRCHEQHKIESIYMEFYSQLYRRRDVDLGIDQVRIQVLEKI
jgi:hypothetical protein